MEIKVSRLYYRIGIVVILAFAVTVVIILKTSRPNGQTDGAAVMAESLLTQQIPVDSLIEEPEPAETVARAVERPPSLGKDVLAMINGEEVTLATLNQEFDALPPQAKEYFKEDKAG
ncbi:hypothetical protein IBX73_11050, partial [candidate division WOR-3 bacterium]|nr:hypothetical protein [candidate division WOR-3 bacterium]